MKNLSFGDMLNIVSAINTAINSVSKRIDREENFINKYKNEPSFNLDTSLDIISSCKHDIERYTILKEKMERIIDET